MNSMSHLIRPTYLVRHGRPDKVTGDLAAAGVSDAEHARDDLLSRGLGRTSVVLSSTAERARRTAEIIGQGLGAIVLYSSRLESYGDNPHLLVRYGLSLEDFIAETLAVQGPPWRPDDIEGNLALVTHGPLIAAAQGEWAFASRLDNIAPYGGVIEYQPGTWQNPAIPLQTQ